MNTVEQKSTSGFTKIGFSKKGFGCCGRYEICNMGILDCYYKELDPEVQDYCMAYQRHHNATSEQLAPLPNEHEEEEVIFFNITTIKNDKKEHEDVSYSENDKGQLSLF